MSDNKEDNARTLAAAILAHVDVSVPNLSNRAVGEHLINVIPNFKSDIEKTGDNAFTALVSTEDTMSVRCDLKVDGKALVISNARPDNETTVKALAMELKDLHLDAQGKQFVQTLSEHKDFATFSKTQLEYLMMTFTPSQESAWLDKPTPQEMMTTIRLPTTVLQRQDRYLAVEVILRRFALYMSQ